jgi:hypothetical protein
MIGALPWRRRRRPPGWAFSAARFEAQQRQRVILMSLIAVASAFVLAQAVLNIGPAVMVIPMSLLLVAAVIWQPRVGLLAVVGMVLLFEVISADPLMLPGQYFNYGLQSTLGVGGFIASPLELLLLLTLGIWLVQGLVRRRLDYRGGDLGWPVSLFFVAVLFGLLRGAVGGGDTYIAFWEARSLLYVGICYLLAANLIRTRRDVAFLLGMLLIANSFYAVEAAYRDLLLVRTGLLDIPQEFRYSHEVVIFLAVLLLQAIIQVVVKGPLWMRIMGVLMAPIGLYALLATHRRAGYIALALAFIIMAIPWVVRQRKALLFIVLPSMVAMAVYLPIFWNNTGVLGQPARAVRSLYEPDLRDASSNDYRITERYNVMETIRSDPFLGVGFGQPFKFVIPLPDLSWWPFWHYQPHHNILWVWLKTGAPGFTIFWILMMGAISMAASRALTVSDPALTTFAYLALASLVASLIFCYVDLGLTNGRVTVFLGTILGVLAVLRRIDADTRAAAGEETPVTVKVVTRTPPPPRPWSTWAASPPSEPVEPDAAPAAPEVDPVAEPEPERAPVGASRG